MDNRLICPFCGHQFEAQDSLCRHGCPLSAVCNLSRCPSCDYEFPTEPRGLSWLRRLFARGGSCRQETVAEPSTLYDLQGGEQARVVGLTSGKASRKNALAVFGLAPGCEISLIERRPAYVVQVGATELALDPEIAHEILIEPV